MRGGSSPNYLPLPTHEPIDISGHVYPYPQDGSLPGAPDWRWIHAPGHSPGQVVFFREADRILIAADAVITVKQNSFYKVLIQKRELQGPPRYLTTNWQAAWDTVKKLRNLRPSILVSGHDQYMKGAELRLGLRNLAEKFATLAIPSHGRFV